MDTAYIIVGLVSSMRRSNARLMNVFVVMMLVFSFLFVVVPVFREPVSAATTIGFTEYNGQNGKIGTRYAASWHDSVIQNIPFYVADVTQLALYGTLGSDIILQRGYVCYNTSSIPDGATITAVNISFPTLDATTATAETLYVQKCTMGPVLEAKDYYYANFSTLFASYAWSGATTAFNLTFDSNLNLAINVTGYSYFVIRGPDDYLDSFSDGYYLQCNSEELIKLWVTYTAPVIPASIEVSQVYPVSGSVINGTCPVLSIHVNHSTSARLNITWYAKEAYEYDDATVTTLPADSIDNDWGTHGHLTDGVLYYVNYSMPDLIFDDIIITWDIRDENPRENVSVPLDVLDEAMIMLRLWYDDMAGVFNYWAYYDGVYNLIETNPSLVFLGEFYEEMLHIDSGSHVLPSYYGYTGEECNHTFYTIFHRYDFDPWILGHMYHWYVNITDGLGSGWNYPNSSADGDMQGIFRCYNFTTGSVNNTDNITVNDINLNTTVSSTTDFVNGTGWVVNYTSESQLGTSENIVNATGTHEYRWNSTSGFWWAWANVTGDLTPIHQFLNMIHATGTHTLLQNSTGYWDWANVTGSGGTPGGTNFTIINPNPGNGTHLIEATTYGVGANYLTEDATGLTTSVDVTCVNFTTPPTPMPGDYSISIEGTHPANTPLVWNSSAVYNTVWDSHFGIVANGNIETGQYLDTGVYGIVRSFIVFDTSVIPEGAVINSGYVSMVVMSDYSYDDFNVTIQKTRQPIPHDPLTIYDFWRYGFNDDLGNLNTSGYVAEDWFNITLNATGINDVLYGDWSLTDQVKWCVRNARDEAAIAPTDWEFIIFYGYGGAIPVWKHPHLILNYTVPSSNWDHFVNLTWYSNSSGAWLPYYVSYVNGNSTVTVPAVNFSSNDTYYWNVSWNSNHASYGNTSVFQFETVTSAGGGSIGGFITSDYYTRYSMYGASFGLMIGCSSGLLIWRRRKKRGSNQENTQETDEDIYPNNIL